jgi:hypothetical protein
MNPWPATDVVKDLATSSNGSVVTARTDLYLQGKRHHIHTTTILIAADRVLSELLHDGEQLPDIDVLQNRNLSNCNLDLTATDASKRVPRVTSPAVRGVFCTDRGRALFLEGAVSDDPVRRREEPPGIFSELMERMHLEPSRDGIHTTRLDPLGSSYADPRDPILARYALIEFVLEGTRQRIRERFGNIDGYTLVVASWMGLLFPRWEDVAGGSILEYRLSEGQLSSGARLVHCDFSFGTDRERNRLTIACVPAARMAALEPKREEQRSSHSAGPAPTRNASQ